jgi:hypothetical protein
MAEDHCNAGAIFSMQTGAIFSMQSNAMAQGFAIQT